MPRRRKADRKIGVLTALIIGVVAVLFFGWLAMMYLPIEGSSGEGFTSMAITVYFEDGTMKTLESSTPYEGQLSLEPMSVYVGGQKITGIRVDCRVTLNDSPTIETWTSNVRQRMELYTSGQSTPLTSSTGEFPNSGAGWMSGQTKTISTIDIPVGQVEAAIAGVGGDGTYYLQVVDEVTLTVQDSYGHTTTLTGSSVGGITLTYVNNTAMSITVNTVVSELV